jgi:tRNA uridine 5-carbamoylmethylation protein Kti12
MQLLFLHGAPGVGKLTIACALSRLVPARLHDNHAAIDLATTIFDFAAPGFWELVHAVRLQILRAAVQHLDNGQADAEDSAQKIVRHFGL